VGLFLGSDGPVKQRKREAEAFTAGRLEPTMPPPRACSGPCLRAQRGYKGQNAAAWCPDRQDSGQPCTIPLHTLGPTSRPFANSPSSPGYSGGVHALRSRIPLAEIASALRAEEQRVGARQNPLGQSGSGQVSSLRAGASAAPVEVVGLKGAIIRVASQAAALSSRPLPRHLQEYPVRR
jgi:hypothetical protein